MKISSNNVNEGEWLPSKTKKKGRYYIPAFENETTKERIVFAKFDSGISYEKIKTNGITHYFVIDGDLVINNMNYERGAYIRVEKNEIFTPSTESGCTVLCIYTEGYAKVE